jgi:2-polyprenyl-6-methoxyphenol hydroxylase-like FAD-dependent oxidoreductase
MSPNDATSAVLSQTDHYATPARGSCLSIVKRVLIVGGGIAGMCAALELRKRNVDVDLIEVDPEWRVYGAGITINAPSLRAFATIGLLPALLEQGAASEGLDLFLANGMPLGSIPAVPATGSTISASVGIIRPVLARILSQATVAAGARVRLGTTFTTLAERESDVEVTLTDGTSARYDLVIGADGINSQVRTALFPDAPKPRYTGQACWRAVVPRTAAIPRAAMYIGRQIKAGLVPISKDEMYMFFLEKRQAPDYIEAHDWPASLRQALAEFSGPIADIREAITPQSRIIYRPLFAVLMPKPWHRRRTVLIGDAAHATTPHLASGAGLAVEDAVVLAAELERATSCETALQEFMARRYERCRMIVENSVRLGDIEQGGGSQQEHQQLMRDSTIALAAAI